MDDSHSEHETGADSGGLRAQPRVEVMTITDVTMWLKKEGFTEDVLSAFEDQEMDGEAICAAFASSPGPDALRDLIPKLGVRLKVYRTFKSALDIQYVQQERSPESSVVAARSSSLTPTNTETTGYPPSGSTVTVYSSPGPSSLKQTVAKPTQRKPTPVVKSKVPDPFPIPKFRQHTQQNLEKRVMGDDDRKYIVTVLGTVLVTYVQRASRKDCLVVAESLVRQYPFLKDPYSWQNYIYTKCQNLNRTPKNKQGDCEPTAKRVKYTIESKAVHTYPLLDGDVEDEISHGRSLQQIRKILQTAKPNHEMLRDLMSRTFGSRRSLIIDDSKAVEEICAEYPLLRKYNYVCLEFSLIFKGEQLEDVFQRQWELWCPAVIEYALQVQNKPAQLKNALRDLESGYEEKEHITVFRTLGYFLRTKKRADSQCTNDMVDVPFLMCQAPRGTPPEEAADSTNNQPHIVQFIDTSDANFSPQYFIVIEQAVYIECKTMTNAIFTLLAVHYVFNLEYNVRVKDFFRFVQEYLMSIADSSKKTVNYVNICMGIESFLSH